MNTRPTAGFTPKSGLSRKGGRVAKNRSGTRVRFWPDRQVFTRDATFAWDELVTRAREDKLTQADVRGGTFTISNHGVSGSLLATPIVINQPQSAILGIGKLEKRPVVVERDGKDELVIRSRCYVTLTIDHRVMDGHRANRFLTVLKQQLEAGQY